MTQSRKHVIVIGAGIGGTATAARLAREGFQVTVVEKNDFVGGRCSLIHQNGHRFDQGPSLYLLPKLFENAFRDLDEKIEDHIELLRCRNNYKVHFNDGDHIQLSSDLIRMKEELDRIEGPEGFGRFLRFLTEAGHHCNSGISLAILRNFVSFFDMVKLRFLPEIFRLHLFDQIYARASKYFLTKKMRMAFTFQTMYMGMSPYDAPAVYSLLQYTEFAEGIWYPRGGFNVVVQRLEAIARDNFGAEFIYNAPVERINVDGRRATGVTLQDGRVINADAVVCNADLVYAYNHLLPPCNWAKNQLTSKKLTSSSISFYWCMSRQVTELDVHNIFLADAYKESFDQIFKDHSLPSEPSFYVNVPSRIDPSAAPTGKDTVIVLVPIGHMREDESEDYDKVVEHARKMVIDVIEARLGVRNFASLIEHESVNHPAIWRDKFNLWRGSILGLSHNITQVLWFRPSTKDSTGRYDNLFFVGASTHPGTGVPIVLAGSKLTVTQVCEHFGRTITPSRLTSGQSKQFPKKSTSGAIYWCLGLALYIIAFAFFVGFPQSPNETAASFINGYLPRTFRVIVE